MILALRLGNVGWNGIVGGRWPLLVFCEESLRLMAQGLAHRKANARVNYLKRFEQLAFSSLNTIPNKHDANNRVKRLNNIRVQHFLERALP